MEVSNPCVPSETRQASSVRFGVYLRSTPAGGQRRLSDSLPCHCRLAIRDRRHHPPHRTAAATGLGRDTPGVDPFASPPSFATLAAPMQVFATQFTIQ